MMGFALADEDLQRIAEASDVVGFFAAPDADPQAWRTFELVGGRSFGPLEAGQEVGNVVLRVLDRDGHDLGGYFVSVATLDRIRPNATDGELVDITVTGLLLAQPHPLAGRMWERWRSAQPTERNSWAELSVDERAAWLEVVRLHTPEHQRDDLPAGSVLTLDGSFVTDPPSLYLALGEAVNGPGGYFGSTLDGVRDCLRGGFGVTAPFTLLWSSAQMARQSLSRHPIRPDSEQSHWDAILEILTEARTTIQLR